MDQSNIRNFCIIAHIDHGKSTLADRLLQLTGTISERDMHEQVLDDMELERERGVTIKASAVRMQYTASDGETYEINLIDTPGHVDFSYEVSRALQACEGAVLVVDATQGIEAQTLANLYMALEQNLEIIAGGQQDRSARRPAGRDRRGDRRPASAWTPPTSSRSAPRPARTSQRCSKPSCASIPAPNGRSTRPLRALIFDSHYDSYKGVIAYVRVIDGTLRKTDTLRLMATDVQVEPIEIGIFSPGMKPIDTLWQRAKWAISPPGSKPCASAAWVTRSRWRSMAPLSRCPATNRSSRWSSPVSTRPTTTTTTICAMRWKSSSLTTPRSSTSRKPRRRSTLVFASGFLGLFHMEIIQERLEREYDLDIVATAPSVEYQVMLRSGESITINSPADLPDESTIEEIREPWMEIEIFAPEEFIGPIMDLVTSKRGEYLSMEYLDTKRVQLKYKVPLAELIVDFYDRLKSGTRGYASLDYHFDELPHRTTGQARCAGQQAARRCAGA